MTLPAVANSTTVTPAAHETPDRSVYADVVRHSAAAVVGSGKVIAEEGRAESEKPEKTPPALDEVTVPEAEDKGESVYPQPLEETGSDVIPDQTAEAEAHADLGAIVAGFTSWGTAAGQRNGSKQRLDSDDLKRLAQPQGRVWRWENGCLKKQSSQSSEDWEKPMVRMAHFILTPAENAENVTKGSRLPW